MKKTFVFFAAFLITALFGTAGFAHAQIKTETNATVKMDAPVSVDGMMGPQGTNPDKPGSIRPQPAKGDFKPMPKDPAAQKKMMEVENAVKNLRAKCMTLSSKAAVVECEKKAESEMKRLQKMEDVDRPQSDEERKENRKEDRIEDRKVDRNDTIRDNAERSVKELRALHERFSMIADRIADRIKSLTVTASNVNTAAAEKYLSSARANLATAKTEIDAMVTAWQKESATLTTAVAEIKKSDDSASVKKESAKNIKESGPLSETRTHMKAAKEALKAAHKNLNEAVKALGPSQPVKADVKANVNVKATTEPVQ